MLSMVFTRLPAPATALLLLCIVCVPSFAHAQVGPFAVQSGWSQAEATRPALLIAAADLPENDPSLAPRPEETDREVTPSERLGSPENSNARVRAPQEKTPAGTPQQKETSRRGSSQSGFADPPSVRPFAEKIVGGSLLGAVVFGFPYEGIGLADILALAVLIFVGLKIVAFTRHPREDNPSERPPLDEDTNDDHDWDTPRPPGSRWDDPNWPRKDKGPRTTQTGPSDETPPPDTIKRRAAGAWEHLRSAPPQRNAASVAKDAQVPEHLDVEDFLDGARALYARLQTSWAARELDDIIPFATPAMMQVIRAQAEHDPTPGTVDILLVNATLTGVEQNKNEERARVLFNVVMRETAANEEAAEPAEVRELWHFTRNSDTGGMWRLDGIEQVQTT